LTGIYTAAFQLSNPRVLADEGEVHVRSVDDLMRWMAVEPSMDWVYTGDGLAVGYLPIRERQQLTFRVIQFYVNGEKPHGLPGARDDAIRKDRVAPRTGAGGAGLTSRQAAGGGDVD
jgi:hypothetical protein